MSHYFFITWLEALPGRAKGLREREQPTALSTHRKHSARAPLRTVEMASRLQKRPTDWADKLKIRSVGHYPKKTKTRRKVFIS